MLVPRLAQAGKALCGKKFESPGQFREQGGQQDVSVGQRGDDLFQRRRRQRGKSGVPDVFRKTQIQPDADDGTRHLAVAAKFDENAAQLGVAKQDVIRPLEQDTVRAATRQRAHDRYADGQRKPGKMRGPSRKIPQHGKGQAGLRRRGPRAPPAAVSGGLPVGDEHRPRRCAFRRPLPQHRIRRRAFGYGNDVETAGSRLQERIHAKRIDQQGRSKHGRRQSGKPHGGGC